MTGTEIEDRLTGAKEKAESCEVAVIGGGVAGLVAAWHLRDRDVLLLEADDRLGGRVKSERRGEYYVNLGAQYMAGTGPLADIIEHFRIPSGSLAGAHAAMALNGRILASDSPLEFVLRAPLSLKGKLEFAQFGLQIRRMYRKMAENPNPQESRAFRDSLDARSIESIVGGFTDPRVRAIINALVATWVGGEAWEVSAATFVLDMGSALIAATETPNFSLPVGGNQTIVEKLAAELGDRARTRATVTSITWDDDGVEVLYRNGAGGEQRVTAKQCVVAVPAYAALDLIRDLPEQHRQALETVHYGPFIVAGIFTNETTAQPWDSTYSIVAPNRSFQIIYNHAAAIRRQGPRKPGGALVAYAGGDQVRRHLAGLSDEEIIDRFKRDLNEVLPGSGRYVEDVVLQRWPQAIPYWHPGDRPLIRALRAPLGPIHFAGDYISFPPSMKAAAQAAETASRAVAQALMPAR